MGEEMRGLRSTNRQLHNSHGAVKYSIGNGVAKEFIHMTYGHEQWWGDCLREWGCWVEGGQRRKNQDDCNSIINKIQFNKELLQCLLFDIINFLFGGYMQPLAPEKSRTTKCYVVNYNHHMLEQRVSKCTSSLKPLVLKSYELVARLTSCLMELTNTKKKAVTWG